MLPALRLVHLHTCAARVPILLQLQLEEALLRSDGGNWAVLNVGAEPPAVVMGLSGKLHRLVNVQEAQRRGTQVIRRFTGGGTVVVDSGCAFVSLVCNSADAVGAPQYPRDIMAWSAAHLYAPVFQRLLAPAAHHPAASDESADGATSAARRQRFQLEEQDYVLQPLGRKIAGNAQSISRARFVHHTSFLWDFSDDAMRLLQMPDKTPAYRAGRDHLHFIARLRDHVHPSHRVGAAAADGPDPLFAAVRQQLATQWSVEDVVGGAADALVAEVLQRPQERRSNQVVDLALT